METLSVGIGFANRTSPKRIYWWCLQFLDLTYFVGQSTTSSILGKLIYTNR